MAPACLRASTGSLIGCVNSFACASSPCYYSPHFFRFVCCLGVTSLCLVLGVFAIVTLDSLRCIPPQLQPPQLKAPCPSHLSHPSLHGKCSPPPRCTLVRHSRLTSTAPAGGPLVFLTHRPPTVYIRVGVPVCNDRRSLREQLKQRKREIQLCLATTAWVPAPPRIHASPALSPGLPLSHIGNQITVIHQLLCF